MAMVTDPVCGMQVDSEKAAGESRYQDKTYYFCTEECLRDFEANPSRYASAAEGRADAHASHEKLEEHEPRFTKTGRMVSPKFGSAGSGGLEYERLPEAHDDHK